MNLTSGLLDTATIVAQASAHGRGGVGVVRLSGTQALSIACALSCRDFNQPQSETQATLFTPRMAQLTRWYASDGQCIDTGLTLYFPAPHSFTGESVIELQAHGGVVVLDWLVQRCVALGARLARPGEFSERAFLNGKLDLVQAEAVADLIDAASREAVIGATRSLQGKFSDEIHSLVDRVIDLRTHIEAAIDFVDEDLETDDIRILSTNMGMALHALEAILANAETGVRFQEGARVAIVGRPNAGKSSLLNALARSPVAIVSDIAGTTRDIIKERLILKGVPLEILDTAGLRLTENRIEQQGVMRAEQALASADLVLWVFDAAQESPEDVERHIQSYVSILNQKPLLRIGNKVDLIEKAHQEALERYLQRVEPIGILCSVTADSGLETLIQAVLTLLGIHSGLEGQFMARRRHLEALQVARMHLQEAQTLLTSQPLELAAEELRLMQESLNKITGEFTTDDLLGKIFSTFCVGK